MNNLCKDIMRWIKEFNKTQTLEELDRYDRVTESVMNRYLNENIITTADYSELDRRRVIAYYRRYQDICVAENCKAD